jgi:hypothetical protein
MPLLSTFYTKSKAFSNDHSILDPRSSICKSKRAVKAAVTTDLSECVQTHQRHECGCVQYNQIVEPEERTNECEPYANCGSPRPPEFRKRGVVIAASSMSAWGGQICRSRWSSRPSPPWEKSCPRASQVWRCADQDGASVAERCWPKNNKKSTHCTSFACTYMRCLELAGAVQ